MGGQRGSAGREVPPDRCRLVDELGRGGMADVYLAVDTLLDREVAVKVLRDQGRLDIERALRVAADGSAALAAAHAQGLVHRDIKPGNVMFEPAGRAKVADFGIARAVAETTAGTGGVLGSVPHISPEQASGDRGRPRRPVLARLARLRAGGRRGRRGPPGEQPGRGDDRGEKDD